MKSLNFIILAVLLINSSHANQAPENPATTPVASQSATPAAVEKSPPPAKPVSLEAAYKREYAFLEAQKRELEKRLNTYKSKAGADEKKLARKIDSLERSSINLSAEIDQLNEELADAERTAVAIGERSEVLDMTYSQAESTLQTYKIDTAFFEQLAEQHAEKVQHLFSQALQLVGNLGIVRQQDGQFFLRDGRQTQGKIIHLGNIAAFGVSEPGSGALVPAGGEHFKLWKEPSQDVAEGLASGQQPQTLKLFLFESRNKAIEEGVEKTWLSIINSGGVIAWVIVALGAFGMLLVLIRSGLLFYNTRGTKKISAQVLEQVADSNLEQAKHVCREDSAITRVIASTLKHLRDDRDHMEDVVSEAILQESGPLDRFGTTIMVIASVSPLLGLLGTVTGMISTFDIITEFGTGDPKLLSSGISVALVTTELGLIVAIPTLLFGSMLAAWSENIKREMEVTTLKITNMVLGGSSNIEKITPIKKDLHANPIPANAEPKTA